MTKLFFELIQIAIGKRESFTEAPSVKEWQGLYEMASKQALIGVLFSGVEKVGKDAGIPKDILLQWFGQVNLLRQYNGRLDACAKEVSDLLAKDSMRSCVLKGQGTAMLYPQPERRQCGDIDLWVEGKRNDVVAYLRRKAKVKYISIKHCDWEVFDGVEVEIHFMPSWFYNPLHHRRFKHWLADVEDRQFTNSSTKGFNVPTSDFNLVYSLVHIYRHLFDEGIGLRQLMDYYYILVNSSEDSRKHALTTLQTFGMRKFVGAVMYVMKEVFLCKDSVLLSRPDLKNGRMLLSEVMIAGNFGKYDQRISHQNKDISKVFTNGFMNLKRNLRFIKTYYSEVLWSVPWKLWHFIWRKYHGYL